MSSRLAERLWRRARLFHEEAVEARSPDLAAFFAEQAIQLALKAPSSGYSGSSMGARRQGATLNTSQEARGGRLHGGGRDC